MSGSRTLKLSILADVDDLKKKLGTSSKEVETFGDKVSKFGKVAAAAFAAAAAAAAAYAGKLAIEGVKAAIEDEAAQKRLALALENATGATEAQIKATEESILQQSLQTGVADDQLRPALQRLAVATGSLSKANDLLAVSLDVAAATGKPLEAVNNAIAKAAEGNTASLARLGIGLSAAELRTMSMTEVTAKLSELFGGAAQTQANTFEGRIQRLKVAFDETKESVGAALLPIIEKLLTFITETFIPNIGKAKDAFKPFTDAIADNKETFMELWAFLKKYVIPILIDGFGKAISTVGTIAGGVVNIIASIVRVIKSVVDNAIDGINALIKAYNAIPILPNVDTINKPSIGSTVTGNTVPSASLPTGFAAAPSVPVSAPKATTGTGAGAPINVTVNGAVDAEGTARTIVDVLSKSVARGGAGYGTSFRAI
jgi:hypothetical protein